MIRDLEWTYATDPEFLFLMRILTVLQGVDPLAMGKEIGQERNLPSCLQGTMPIHLAKTPG